jgi:ElaB/YqjD/DUF883 family membrane-anchored ribosome-binding protein
MTGPDQHSEPNQDASVEAIQADIERTREQLGETVGALSSKLDVKQRAKEKVADTKELVAEKARAVPALPIAVAAAVALLVGVVIWKRRR